MDERNKHHQRATHTDDHCYASKKLNLEETNALLEHCYASENPDRATGARPPNSALEQSTHDQVPQIRFEETHTWLLLSTVNSNLQGEARSSLQEEERSQDRTNSTLITDKMNVEMEKSQPVQVVSRNVIPKETINVEFNNIQEAQWREQSSSESSQRQGTMIWNAGQTIYGPTYQTHQNIDVMTSIVNPPTNSSALTNRSGVVTVTGHNLSELTGLLNPLDCLNQTTKKINSDANTDRKLEQDMLSHKQTTNEIEKSRNVRENLSRSEQTKRLTVTTREVLQDNTEKRTIKERVMENWRRKVVQNQKSFLKQATNNSHKIRELRKKLGNPKKSTEETNTSATVRESTTSPEQTTNRNTRNTAPTPNLQESRNRIGRSSVTSDFPEQSTSQFAKVQTDSGSHEGMTNRNSCKGTENMIDSDDSNSSGCDRLRICESSEDEDNSQTKISNNPKSHKEIQKINKNDRGEENLESSIERASHDECHTIRIEREGSNNVETNKKLKIDHAKTESPECAQNQKRDDDKLLGVVDSQLKEDEKMIDESDSSLNSSSSDVQIIWARITTNPIINSTIGREESSIFRSSENENDKKTPQDKEGTAQGENETSDTEMSDDVAMLSDNERETLNVTKEKKWKPSSLKGISPTKHRSKKEKILGRKGDRHYFKALSGQKTETQSRSKREKKGSTKVLTEVERLQRDIRQLPFSLREREEKAKEKRPISSHPEGDTWDYEKARTRKRFRLMRNSENDDRSFDIEQRSAERESSTTEESENDDANSDNGENRVGTTAGEYVKKYNKSVIVKIIRCNNHMRRDEDRKHYDSKYIDCRECKVYLDKRAMKSRKSSAKVTEENQDGQNSTEVSEQLSEKKNKKDRRKEKPVEKSPQIRKEIIAHDSQSQTTQEHRRNEATECPEGNDWLDHSFAKGKVEYPFKLCPITTAEITAHYKTSHSESEVLIPIQNAECLVDNCRVCDKANIKTFRHFFLHLTEHTRGYMFWCPINDCNLTSANEENLTVHVALNHPNVDLDTIKPYK